MNATSNNISSSRVPIDNPDLNGNPQAIIIATPVGNTAVINKHPIGAWYYNNKWNIFNTDHATMPAGLKFKLQVFLKPDANHFLHIITRENLGDEGSYLNNPLLNNNPNAQVTIFQNYAPDNRPPYNLNKFEAKAFYNSASGKWYIANVNGKDLFQSVNTAYSVVISPADSSNITSSSSNPSPIASRTRMPINQNTTQPTPTTTTPQPRPLPTPSPTPTTTQPSTDFCTKETAYQTMGKWGKQKKDDLVMADRNFPKEQYKPVLAKAQKVIDLFMKASPEFKGIQAYAQRSIRSDSYISNGALPFSIDIGYGSFHCIEKGEGTAEERGKIIVFGGYGYTTVYFNSLRDVLESVQDGGAFLTTDGEEIFDYKKQLGEFKGFILIEPMARSGNKEEAIIITPDNRLPYKPVTREQYLQARLKDFQSKGGFAKEITSLTSAIGNMSPAERQMPAIVRDISALPGSAKLFVSEAEGGRHLVTIDKSFFNPKLPRDTIQFITVHWNWNDTDIPKAEAIRQFKQNFDFEALKQMLGK